MIRLLGIPGGLPIFRVCQTLAVLGYCQLGWESMASRNTSTACCGPVARQGGARTRDVERVLFCAVDGEAKVPELELVAVCQEDVLRLDVPMDPVVAMQRLEHAQQRLDHLLHWPLCCE